MANLVAEAVRQEVIPRRILARASGWAEPQNLSRFTNDFAKIQEYISAGERGDMTMLYALWRDLLCGDGHIQSELAKRKMVVSGQPYTIVAADRENDDDAQAAEAIKWMIRHCDNWDEGMNHLLDATTMAKVAAEKIFEPYTPTSNDKYPYRFRLKKFFPINYTLYNYLVAYIPQGNFGLPPQSAFQPIPLSSFQNPAMIYDPDQWQAELRFYSTFPNGMVNRSWAQIYAPEPNRHIIHEASLFPGVRDNFGLSMRPLVFWWFLSVQSRDWWARFMERFGQPFLKGKTDSESVDAMTNMTNAFAQATKLSGIIIDRRDEVEIVQTQVNQGAQGYEAFVNFCNKEKSKLILGHADASETSKGDGLKKGTGEQVMKLQMSYQQYDKKMLCNTLQRQLFRQFLDMNGLTGEAPEIWWGGIDQAEIQTATQALVNLKQAGLKLTDKSKDEFSEKFGYELEFDESGGVNNANGKGDKQLAAAAN